MFATAAGECGRVHFILIHLIVKFKFPQWSSEPRSRETELWLWPRVGGWPRGHKCRAREQEVLKQSMQSCWNSWMGVHYRIQENQKEAVAWINQEKPQGCEVKEVGLEARTSGMQRVKGECLWSGKFVQLCVVAMEWKHKFQKLKVIKLRNLEVKALIFSSTWQLPCCQKWRQGPNGKEKDCWLESQSSQTPSQSRARQK